MKIYEYILQGINLLFACGFLLLFSTRIIRLRHLSETTRYLNLFPCCRAVFVIIFIVLNILQIISMCMFGEWDWTGSPIPWLVLGTTLNSIILMVELCLLRLEILKQRPYTPVHRFYWIYLPIVSLFRLILTVLPGTILSQTEQLQQIILSSVTLADTIFLCIYSLFFKRQEIQEFQTNSLFVFDNLRNNLMRGEAWIATEFGGTMPTGREVGVFPYMLKAEVQVASETEICVRTYTAEGIEAKRYVMVDSFEEFYTAACKFDIKAKLNFEEIQFNIEQLQGFLNELLGDWRNYENFVLQFLGIPSNRISQISRRVQEFKAKYSTLPFFSAPLDPFCLILNVGVTKAVQIRTHYEFFIHAEIVKNSMKREVHKRYTQFDELDKKLKSLEIRSGMAEMRLRMPDFPEKYYLNLDEESVDERRGKLQGYLRRVCNDKIIMCKYRESRAVVLEFLGFTDHNMHIQPPQDQPHQSFTFQPLQISKIVVNDRPATYYTFLINSLPPRKICKRYSEFQQLQRQLKRWMHNTQVQYRSVILPAKRIKNMSQKDKITRHRELTNYLNVVIGEVKGVEECYEWRVFLGTEDREKEESVVRSAVKIEAMELSSRSVVRSSLRSSRGLSNLIDNLGGDSASRKY